MTFIHTTSWALYNEIDEFAAAWLEQLIAAGHIAPGVVDRRSIVDIRPDDLRGFRQVHLFAGIGVWSFVFRRSGISDDTEAWSASCPCQPFSAAGPGAGMDDERHLWPHAHHLIRERRPRLIFGEQVASKDGLAWLDLVQADMEGTGYAFGAVDTCAAGFGAPHIRQRQYWFGERLADREGVGRDLGTRLCDIGSRGLGRSFATYDGTIEWMDDDDARLEGLGGRYRAQTGQWEGQVRPTSASGEPVGLADTHLIDDDGAGSGASPHGGELEGPEDLLGFFDPLRVANTDDRQLQEPRRRSEGRDGAAAGSRMGHNRRPGPTNGFWSDVDWLFCRDGKWRPVEPGTFPLAHGAAFRMGCVCAGCGAESIREGSVSVLRNQLEGNEGCEPETLLRQGMLPPPSLGTAVDEQEHRSLSGEEIGATGVLLGVLLGEQFACPSQGPDRFERRSEQPASTLRGMPSDRTYRHTAIDVRGMPDAFHREITSEPEQDLFCEVCQRVGTHFCEEEVGGGRVGKLRGYGNAINAEQAIGFVEAYLETKALEIDIEPVRHAARPAFEDLM